MIFKEAAEHILNKVGESSKDFVNVYYRLDSSQTYEWGKGSIGIEDKNRRNEESLKLAKSIGFDTFIKGSLSSGAQAGNLESCEKMYVHPMEVTMTIRKENVEKYQKAIEDLNSPLFKLERTAVFPLRGPLTETLGSCINSLLTIGEKI